MRPRYRPGGRLRSPPSARARRDACAACRSRSRAPRPRDPSRPRSAGRWRPAPRRAVRCGKRRPPPRTRPRPDGPPAGGNCSCRDRSRRSSRSIHATMSGYLPRAPAASATHGAAALPPRGVAPLKHALLLAGRTKPPELGARLSATAPRSKCAALTAPAAGLIRRAAFAPSSKGKTTDSDSVN